MANNHKKIISNIAYIKADEYISLANVFAGSENTFVLPEVAEPRILVKQILRDLANKFPDNCIVIAVRMVGRRQVETLAPEVIAKMINGRRHRIYYGIFLNNKTYVVFSWNKVKHLSKVELEFVQKNWHPSFFESKCFFDPTSNSIENGICGNFLTETGGTSIAQLLYRFYPALFIA